LAGSSGTLELANFLLRDVRSFLARRESRGVEGDEEEEEEEEAEEGKAERGVDIASESLLS
jgi:hypothetical protein